MTLPEEVAGNCSSVTVDSDGNLWITVDGGILVHYDVAGRVFRYYSEEDGMEERWFNGRRGSLTSSRGNIFLSGSSGLMIVHPDKARTIWRKEVPLQASLLSVVVDGVPAIVETGKTLKVPNRFGSVKVRISTERADPFVPHRYQYRLEGRSHEPAVLSDKEEYTIQNHAPGSYSLLVSTMTHKGWSGMVPVVNIRVMPPLWFRWYMWMMYAALAGAACVFLYKWREKKAQMLAAQDRQLQEKKQVEDQILFMTNIAHELRTPLTLIYNPVKRLIERERLPDPVHNTLAQVSRQVLRITQMVDMVLDIHKMDVTGSSLFIEPVALNQWIRKFVSGFRMELEEKDLTCVFELDEGIGDVNLDRIKIETALSNLVMNSIKYSDSGTITIRTSRPDEGHVRVAVSDEGRGFSGDPERLFQRFYQKDENAIGYGIGLSYTKMLVEKHGGTVGARPNEKVGSTFWFDLPTDLKTEDFLTEYRLPSGTFPPMILDDDLSADEFRTDTQTLLVVDNQESILRYIRQEYQSLFKHIYTATDGREALEIIKIKLPSVVVSDVVMPVMNGFELCKAVKSDISISHIPVILLTARDDMQNQVTGYKLGADCYVPKPFDIRMLYYIIRTQLRNRSAVKRQYATAAFQNSTQDLTFSLVDEKFILKLNKFVLENLADPELDIDKVADHMCISRTTLFYKMNDLTGMSMGRYIRKLRISRAKEMLEKTDESINDISVRLGFSESRYFSTVFKQETGETPSQYKKRVRAERRDA